MSTTDHDETTTATGPHQGTDADRDSKTTHTAADPYGTGGSSGMMKARANRRRVLARLSLGVHGVPVLSVAVLLVLWQFVPKALNIDPFVFPPLSDVVDKFTNRGTLRLLLDQSEITIVEAVVGLAIGAVSGVVFGFVFGEMTFVRRAFYPLLIAFQSLPKVAVAPLFVIWFGFGSTPKILVVVVLCFFPLLVNTMTGVMSVDTSRRDLFTSLCASRLQMWRRLLLPSTLPSIFAGLEVAVVFSLLGAITGEFVAADSGLGVLLQQFKVNYDTAGVFAVLILLSVYGVVLNQMVRIVGDRLLFWRKS